MENTHKVRIWNSLKRLRTAAGLTQVELAQKADIDRATLALLENSKRTAHSRTIFKLAQALGVDVGQLDDLQRTEPNEVGN